MNRKPLNLNANTVYRISAYLKDTSEHLSVFGISESAVISRQTTDVGNGWNHASITFTTGDKAPSVFVRLPNKAEYRFVVLEENPVTVEEGAA